MSIDIVVGFLGPALNVSFYICYEWSSFALYSIYHTDSRKEKEEKKLYVHVCVCHILSPLLLPIILEFPGFSTCSHTLQSVPPKITLHKWASGLFEIFSLDVIASILENSWNGLRSVGSEWHKIWYHTNLSFLLFILLVIIPLFDLYQIMAHIYLLKVLHLLVGLQPCYWWCFSKCSMHGRAGD